MLWENLTVPGFEKAVEKCEGVAILPVGVIEAHGAHLPLGQDALAAHWVAYRAAEREPAIVFPMYPWGINHEAYHLPGSVILSRELVMKLLEEICDEMGRNGIKKIILLLGHGGCRHVLPLFVQTFTEKKRPYLVYFSNPFLDCDFRDILESGAVDHAGEGETSISLHCFPELVKMDNVPPEPFNSLQRNKALREAGLYSPVDWYAMFPTMYCGNAKKATAEKGKQVTDKLVAALVKAIRAVKNDEVTEGLLDEFMKGKENPKSAY